MRALKGVLEVLLEVLEVVLEVLEVVPMFLCSFGRPQCTGQTSLIGCKSLTQALQNLHKSPELLELEALVNRVRLNGFGTIIRHRAYLLCLYLLDLF